MNERARFLEQFSTVKTRSLAEAAGWSFRGFYSVVEDQRGWPSGEEGFLVAVTEALDQLGAEHCAQRSGAF